MISFAVKYRAEILAVGAALAFYTAWVYKSVIADKLQVLWKTKVVTAFNATAGAAKKLWASLAANPWVALIAGVTAAGVAIYKFAQRSQEAKKIVGDVNEAATKSYAEEEAKIRELTTIIEDNNISLQLRNEKLEELKSIVPGYHASLTTEGELINKLHEVGFSYDGIVFNAGAYTHTSVALHDAIKAINTPVVEVHISNVYQRETYRHTSLITGACLGVIGGFGIDSYRLAIEAILAL